MSSSKVFKEDKEFRPARLLARDFEGISDWSSGALFVKPQSPDHSQDVSGGGAEAGDGQASVPRGIDAIKKESYDKGLQDGLKQAEEQFLATLQSLQSILGDIDRLREDILKNSSEDMIRLIIAIARQVIRTEISIQPEIIVNTLGEALQVAVRSDECVVRIHPDDLEFVSSAKADFMSRINDLKNISIETDPRISRGGCVIESDYGKVDATVETQLEEIYQHLSASSDKG